MKTNANDLVHPVVVDGLKVDAGLTKREYFAAMAMQGFLCQSPVVWPDKKMISMFAIKQADSLIDELNKDFTKI